MYVTHDQEEALSLSDRIVVMNEGRIEQVGPPGQIYGHPETGFVARFVGHLNVITARVIDPAAGTVAIGDQQLTVTSGASAIGELTQGQSVPLAVRPEAIKLHDGVPGWNAFRGDVEEVTFLGATIRTRLRLDDGSILIVDAFNDSDAPPPAPATSLTVSFPSSAVLVLRESSPEA